MIEEAGFKNDVFCGHLISLKASQVVQLVKNLPAIQETPV